MSGCSQDLDRLTHDEDLGNSSDPLTEIPQLSAEVVCC